VCPLTRADRREDLPQLGRDRSKSKSPNRNPTPELQLESQRPPKHAQRFAQRTAPNLIPSVRPPCWYDSQREVRSRHTNFPCEGRKKKGSTNSKEKRRLDSFFLSSDLSLERLQLLLITCSSPTHARLADSLDPHLTYTHPHTCATFILPTGL
jgi:hypothetical protein